MCNDSGVVMRTCGDLRSMRARADCGVSPVRTATRISGNGSPAASKRSRSSVERALEIALDVVVQRLERRDVEDLHRVRQRRRGTVDDELIQLPEKRREGLTGAGRREDQRVRSTRDRRPPLALRRARRAERFLEPGSNERVEFRLRKNAAHVTRLSAHGGRYGNHLESTANGPAERQPSRCNVR